MGQLKYEKEFREKLNKREVAPSAGSWEKLQFELDIERKKKIDWFKWAGIAAALIAGIIVIGLLYNHPIPESPAVVETPSKEIKVNAPQVVEETVKQVPSILEPPAAPQNQQEISYSKEKSSIIAEANVKKEATENLNKYSPIAPVKGNNFSKTEEAIAQNTSPEEAKVTDAEVDALLAKARAEINSQRNSNVVNVNANDLLWNVEMEMEQSFREKVFDVLKEGFDKAKTAVANRNN